MAHIMTKKKNADMSSIVIAILLCIFLFYYSYRYLFQYNSELTSPTYSDTPLLLQLAKYVICILLCVALFFSVYHDKIVPKHKALLICITIIIFQNIYSLCLQQSAKSVISICCLLPVSLVLLVNKRISLDPIEKIIHFFMYYTIAYELLQLALYFIFGRLPALAYQTGHFTDVRFGGVWDAPNEFVLVFIFYIAYCFYKFKGLKRVVLTSLFSIFLLLTWSMTGFVAFFATLLIWGCIKLVKNKKMSLEIKVFLIVGILIAFVSAICVALIFFPDKILYFLQSKHDSAVQHFMGWDLNRFSGLTFLGLAPTSLFTESSFVSLIAEGGILHLVLVYGMIIYGVVLAYRNCLTFGKNGKYKGILIGIFFYQLSFLIGSLNIPYVHTFSNLGIFSVFFILTVTIKDTFASAIGCPSAFYGAESSQAERSEENDRSQNQSRTTK